VNQEEKWQEENLGSGRRGREELFGKRGEERDEFLRKNFAT